MIKTCIFFLIITSSIYSQDNPVLLNQFKTEKIDSISQISNDNRNSKFIHDIRLWWEAGINISDFQNIKNENRFGYSAGMTFSHDFNNYIITFSGFVSRQSLFLRQRKGSSSDGNFIYRMLYDYYISLLFIDIPVMINYKIWSNGSKTLYAGLGIGYSISIKDYSERSNFFNTREVISTGDLVDGYYIEDSVYSNSGVNFKADIWCEYKNFMFKFLYINKRYNLKKIDKPHTFSLHIGFSLR